VKRLLAGYQNKKGAADIQQRLLINIKNILKAFFSNFSSQRRRKCAWWVGKFI